MDNDYKAQAVIVAMLAADMATDGGRAAAEILEAVTQGVTDAERLRVHDAIGTAVIVLRDLMPD
jgi:hypothetical protein